MGRTKVQQAVAGLLFAGAAIVVVSQHRLQTSLGEQNAALQRQLAELRFDNEDLSNRLARMTDKEASLLAAPSLPPAPIDAGVGDGPTNIIALLVHGGDIPSLTAAQLKRYLDENHRNAASLLSAYRTSRDPALLEEAMTKYPGDPQVAFEAIFKKDASPAERRAWLDAFKQAAPENPMASYLSAQDYFKSGQKEQGLQDVLAASGRPGFADYTPERIQNDEEAYRAAGYSEADARMAASWGVTLPQLADLKKLGQNMVGLAADYRQAGDQNSAQAALQMALTLGKQLDGSPGTGVPLVNRLVGMAVEKIAFDAMDPTGAYGDGTVQEQLDQLAQRKTSIKDLVKQSAPFQQQMTPEDWLNYNDRTRAFGEENAIAWLLNKYGSR